MQVNLRNAENYTIGLDIGTGSVGWAVVDESGKLCKFKGKNTWGSRLFDSAKTAADTRFSRTLRRRYGRRKRRILQLREFMWPEIEKIDPEFFIRLEQSSLWEEDRSFTGKHALFAGTDLSERDFYETYPTIYHVRQTLMDDPSKADIRVVYLALHHAMKYRGHFLNESESMSAKDADATVAIELFLEELKNYCSDKGFEYCNSEEQKDTLNAIITHSQKYRRERQEEFSSALNLPPEMKKESKAFGDAVLGYQVKYSVLFDVEDDATSKFSLSTTDKVEAFEAEFLPDENQGFFQAVKGLHNAYVLAGILKQPGLSESMVYLYNQHHDDLNQLKQLIKKYFPKNTEGQNLTYNEIFRGARWTDGAYKKSEAKGYTGYILGNVKPEDFYKQLKSLFEKVELDQADGELWRGVIAKMEEGDYLRKLRMSDNGAIPHQLHFEEMHSIIENQKQYYPALAQYQDEIEQVFKFRLPYYIGPLGHESNPKRTKPFSWAVRREGHELTEVRPWNFDEVIDRDASAEAFITNLTGECSYFLGKKVIPKNSLLYAEFCVRQELNVCKVASDGENFARLDNETMNAVFEGVFKNRSRVRTEDVRSFLKNELGLFNTAIEGTQKENEFASSLKAYCDFKRILCRDIETLEDFEMVEQLIAWITIFEDKKILKRKTEMTYGPSGNGALDDAQVKAVTKLRYTGWSNLSKEFLEELRVEFEGTPVSIMSILRNSRKVTPMNLMEILADKRFGFSGLLEEKNAEFLQDGEGWMLDSIPGSPAIKRGINQSMKIVDEIVRITGKPPVSICVEMAREDVGKGKGSRTKTREKQIQDAYSGIGKELRLYEGQKELKEELSRHSMNLDNQRVFLYFLQRGKCLYCGKKLAIENLANLQVDHIVPQSFVKDDSIDNKALVCSSCNQQKRDVYPLPDGLRAGNFGRWKELLSAGLISKKKFNNLTTSKVTERQAKGFINRQLVETRQISKHVVTLLQSVYPDTAIETVKAELSSNLRKQYGFNKVREINDYHHAHDAYLACQLSRFLSVRYPKMADDLDYRTFSRYAMATKTKTRSHTGLIIGSFGIDGFDKETGEVFRDAWDAESELIQMRACLNYKDCFISRKTEMLTGEFWNQTVYSPRKKTEKAIPLKKGKDPNKYGYYQGVNSAYYSFIEYTDEVRGKKKQKVELVGIPVNASYSIKNSADLQTYLEGRYDEPKVIRARVMKYQKIEWAGCSYYLTSPTEMINARQLWLPARYVTFLYEAKNEKLLVEREDADALLWEIFCYLREQVKLCYPRYQGVYEKLAAEKTGEKFEALARSEKVAAIFELLGMLHCDAMRGLKGLGLGDASGRMQSGNFGTSISDIQLIDLSVTGMFEKRDNLEF